MKWKLSRKQLVHLNSMRVLTNFYKMKEMIKKIRVKIQDSFLIQFKEILLVF